MKDVLLYTQSRPQSQADRDDQTQVTKPTREQRDLTMLGIPYSKEDQTRMDKERVDVKCWRTARNIGTALGIPGFFDALAVFVQESRKKSDGVATPPHLVDRLEADSAWAGDCFAGLHNSVLCWERDGRDNKTPDKLVEQHAYCSPR